METGSRPEIRNAVEEETTTTEKLKTSKISCENLSSSCPFF